ncbi:hypothetical protein RV09_GL000524 [Enterococcus moraviensis]|nr:hypothetical protein RV09_GL000524 [Enterococcus moraviensis]
MKATKKQPSLFKSVLFGSTIITERYYARSSEQLSLQKM